MIIDLIEYLGQVKNDTNILGKAFLFNVIDIKENNSYTFECILFVHEYILPFISLSDDDLLYNKDEILKVIFEKYTIKQLLEA